MLPGLAVAQDVQKIKETMLSKKMERGKDIESYVVAQWVVGNPVVMMFEAVKDEDGNFQGFRQVPGPELMRRADTARGGMTPEQRRQFAEGYSSGLGMLDQGLRSETGGLSPFDMMGANMGVGAFSSFLRAGAPSEAELEAERQKEKDEWKQSLENLDAFWKTAKLVGTEKVGGRKAYHLRSTKVGKIESAEDVTFDAKTASMWIDTEEFVSLKFKAEGTMTAGKETRPVVMEVENSDYRTIEDALYEPFKQSMRMEGMMDEKQRKELEKAKKQMAEFEKQMANMPAQQKAMMERMMGPQLEKMRTMLSGDGGFNVETEVHEIKVGGLEVFNEMQEWANQNMMGAGAVR